MEVTVLKPCVLTVETVKIDVALHDLDDVDSIPDFLLDGGDLSITINVDTGQVMDWEGNQPVSINIKVCDNGTYTLFDPQGNELAQLMYEYVPNDLIPGKNRDYIDLQINASGQVTNWPKNPCVLEFFSEE